MADDGYCMVDGDWFKGENRSEKLGWIITISTHK